MLLAGCFLAAQEAPQTLRVDFYHHGNALEEGFSLHKVVIEPLPWPGNPARPIDDTNRGLYFFEVVKPVTNEVLYSRGFSSIFGEWQLTGEAGKMNRTFHESLRFPKPDHPVRLRLSKRDDANRFAAIWTADIDPGDMLVQHKAPPAPGPVISILNSGSPSQKVDWLIIGDGYTAAEGDKFERDAQRLGLSLFNYSPFRERKSDFNIWAINPPAAESGTNRPSNGTFRWSPTGTTYDAFRSERYVLAFDNLGLRNIAQNAPYDFILIMVNSETYGGGGIFGLYSTAAADNHWAEYLVVHEFGHHFAALADEYYTSSVAYQSGDLRVEPWEPNATALQDPANLKWKDLVAAGTPLPTPWPKEKYEAFQKENQARRAQIRAENRPESEMHKHFQNEQAFVNKLFGDAQYGSRVGAFEGANYEATGYYRPEINCLMFTRHDQFCRVCSRSVTEIIDLYVGE
ncbi:MAG: peptidase M64 [Calditrichaeota bacterium]|nr:peptidase M64 [Calditrichota bacterium]